MDLYLTFVPRGLHMVARTLILHGLKEYAVEADIVGDISPGDTTTPCEDVVEPLKAHKRCKRNTTSLADLCRRPVRTAVDGHKNHMSVGYNEEDQVLWTTPGCFPGVVWIKISTTAPPFMIAVKLRCIGPILALAVFQEGLEMDESASMEKICHILSKTTNSPSYAIVSSLDLWRRHVLECWPEILPRDTLDGSFLNRIRQGTDAALTYRLSCVRPEKKNYQFQRQELAAAAADIVIPLSTARSKDWKVELKGSDVEFVLVFKAHCLAIGINLRPYGFLGAKDFSSGSLLPPDITPPYLSGSTLSGLVRLRPTTAHMMLHLAQLQPGDILLDPCAGIGKRWQENIPHFVSI